MVLTFKVGNALPSQKVKVELRVGDVVAALMEQEFLGVPFQIRSTRSGKEWL
jgi:hypothetical protein